MEAAWNEFGIQEYAKASLGHMCKENGISKGLLFHYFTGKDQIFTACVIECFEKSILSLKEEYQLGDTVEESMRNYFALRSSFFGNNPRYALVYCQAIFRSVPEVIDAVKPIIREWDKYRREVLREVFKDIIWRTPLDLDTAIKVISKQNDYINLDMSRLLRKAPERTGQIFEDHEKRFLFYLDVLLYGMAEERRE